jgi:hypothetical protein
MVKKGHRVYTCELDLKSFSEDILLARGLKLTPTSDKASKIEIESI